MEVIGVSTAASTRPPYCEFGVTIDWKSSKHLTTRSQFAKKQQKKEERILSNIRRQDVFAKSGTSDLVMLSLAAGLAKVESVSALSYDEIIGGTRDVVESLPSLPEMNLDVDTWGFTNFIAENLPTVVGGLAVLALPIIVSNVYKKSQNYGTVSAKQAFRELGNAESVTQLLDIREGKVIRAEGTPDLRGYKKRVTQIPYTTVNVEAFVVRVKGKFKKPEETELYILDRFDGSALAAAKLLIQNGFKAAYAIKDGAEGPSGWQSSELPWLKPRKGFTFDLPGLKDVFDTDNSSLVPATLGVAAAAGVGLVVFSEVEIALQLLGSAALVQILVKKLLFAKDRKKTFEDLQLFVDTKIAPKELMSELQSIGKVFLPEYKEIKEAAVNGAATVEKSVEAAAPAVVGTLAVSEINQAKSPSVVGAVASNVEITPPAALVSTDASFFAAGETVPEPKVEEGKVERKELVTVTPSISTDLLRIKRASSPYTQFPGMKPPPPPSKP
ncbi:hypothetical protein R1flu_008662 [Riccia fluitans]|uniref:Uncharacterized protein n=1 Tax=Riccia fluitans TaxID=41844 RepID=A0ABD1YCD8_9MARC